jgi:hypothetical protein
VTLEARFNFVNKNAIFENEFVYCVFVRKTNTDYDYMDIKQLSRSLMNRSSNKEFATLNNLASDS